MAINSRNAAVHSWECIGLDADERQMAEELVEKTPKPSAERFDLHYRKKRSSKQPDDGYDLYAAHDSHRWSPVTHYLEPYL
ncbi:MAG: hypothetical protein H6617_00625 [Bdellovibrionaceae bacterium]|nr:hypothetical protein [Bdellovibrionales bacterium]MCB9253171.1 hypothetical protein [Pseudobdellovibrionaceae bacterium]